MRTLIIGATGLFGHALVTEAKRRNFQVSTAARTGAEFNLDIAKADDICNLVEHFKPQLVINSAALVNIQDCEINPGLAYEINSRPAAILASLASRHKFNFVQISTDHFFSGDGNIKHKEEHPVVLVNEYARSKYCSEQFALTSSQSLVVRTNIVGFSPKTREPAFADWAVQTLEAKGPLVLFDDFYTSSIDIYSCAKALYDIVLSGHKGLINLSSSQVSSKKEFIQALASALKLDSSYAKIGSVATLTNPQRAESLGLDVSKAENILGYKLPDLKDVTQRLATEHFSLSTNRKLAERI